MSQGTSGDQMWMDYGQRKKTQVLDAVRCGCRQGRVRSRTESIKYPRLGSPGGAETTLTLKRRAPDAARLAWAKANLARMSDRDPRAGEIRASHAYRKFMPRKRFSCTTNPSEN